MVHARTARNKAICATGTQPLGQNGACATDADAVECVALGGRWLAEHQFVDRYEVLQLSPNATAETIERVYRLLAKRYHPDNRETGDEAKFVELCESYDVLSNPVTRAQYDVTYDQNRSVQASIVHEASTGSTPDDDRRLFRGILLVLYAARRRDPKRGGIGIVHLERMLAMPEEHLEFPLWYLKQRGYLEVLDSGQMAITANGVDHLGDTRQVQPRHSLLPETNA